MELFLHQVLAGLATGGIYACMALAIVMIYQAIDHLNFAQGEMAMFSTFHRLATDAMGPAVLGRHFLRRLPFPSSAASRSSASCSSRCAMRRCFSHIVVFIALFAILNSLAGFIWDFTIKSFPSPFGTRPLFGSGLIEHA